MIADPPAGADPETQRLRQYLQALADADWTDPTGPIRLAADLTPEEVRSVAIVHNTRVFLRTAGKQGGAAATATGNLNRAFVKQVWDDLMIHPLYRETTLRLCKVINELDVWPLHLARTLAELGRLVVRRKKRFIPSRLGRALTAEDQAGILYRHLFITYFRKMDLRYAARWRDVPEIQPTMATVLWRLAAVANDWVPVEGLAPIILPPSILPFLHQAMVTPFDTEESIIASYVLNPLLGFDLIEPERKSDWPMIGEKDRIRVTPLFRRFLSFVPFDLSGEPPPDSYGFAA